MASPAWHPDPLHRHELRWFDGSVWTAQVSDGGVTGVDPLGVSPTPDPQHYAPQPQAPQPQAPQPRSPRTSRGGIRALLVGVALVAAVVVGAFVLIGSEDDAELADEIAGVRTLLDDASPGDDDFVHLGDDCVVDVIDILDDARVDVLDGAEAEEAAAYAAAGFDRPFYDCYVAANGFGYALDAVEIGAGATVDDLHELLEDIADDVDRLNDEVQDGSVIEACTDTEVVSLAGDIEDDAFCEYFWTFDGAGLAIVAAAHASLGMNGPDVLNAAVPDFLEALVEAAD